MFAVAAECVAWASASVLVHINKISLAFTACDVLYVAGSKHVYTHIKYSVTDLFKFTATFADPNWSFKPKWFSAAISNVSNHFVTIQQVCVIDNSVAVCPNCDFFDRFHG